MRRRAIRCFGLPGPPHREQRSLNNIMVRRKQKVMLHC